MFNWFKNLFKRKKEATKPKKKKSVQALQKILVTDQEKIQEASCVEKHEELSECQVCMNQIKMDMDEYAKLSKNNVKGITDLLKSLE